MRPNLTLITNPREPKGVKKKENPESVKSLLKDWFKIIEKKYESALTMAGTRSFHLGYKIRDSLKPGDVSFLFSAPKVGATAILMKIIEEYNEAEFPILYVNSKMERTEFITRLLASHTGLPLDSLRRATLYEDDWAKLTMRAAALLEDYIYFSNDYHVDCLSLCRNRGFCLNKNNERGLVVFDNYLDMDALDGNRLQAEGKKLRKIAVECDVPILATVRLPSMDNFYQSLKLCSGSLLFDDLEKMGAILSLNTVGKRIYVHLLSKKRQASGYARIDLRHDSASISYVY